MAIEAGWPGLLISEEHGGAGLGAYDAMLVAQEAGRVLAPAPLLGPLPAIAAAGPRRRRGDRGGRRRRAEGGLAARTPAERSTWRAGRSTASPARLAPRRRVRAWTVTPSRSTAWSPGHRTRQARTCSSWSARTRRARRRRRRRGRREASVDRGRALRRDALAGHVTLTALPARGSTSHRADIAAPGISRRP